MKLAVIGSRSFDDYNLLEKCLDKFLDKFLERNRHDLMIVSGGAKGADTLAERYANSKCLEIEIFKPDWKSFKKRAGFVRNQEICYFADVIIAFWDGESKGTKHSFALAETYCKPLIVLNYMDNTFFFNKRASEYEKIFKECNNG